MNDSKPTRPQDRECSRRLANGMIMEAVNDAARQAWDPLLIVHELERQWKETDRHDRP
jgi:hypothetical protein